MYEGRCIQVGRTGPGCRRRLYHWLQSIPDELYYWNCCVARMLTYTECSYLFLKIIITSFRLLKTGVNVWWEGAVDDVDGARWNWQSYFLSQIVINPPDELAVCCVPHPSTSKQHYKYLLCYVWYTGSACMYIGILHSQGTQDYVTDINILKASYWKRTDPDLGCNWGDVPLSSLYDM